jgi:hypothetical protein
MRRTAAAHILQTPKYRPFPAYRSAGFFIVPPEPPIMSSKDDKVNTTKKVAKKKATAKKVAKKAAAKTAVSKKAVTKKSVSKKAASKKVSKKVAAAASAKATISYSEYRERVAMAAYFIAEKRLFDNGLPDSDWLEGEKQVLAALAAQGIEVAVD